MAGRLTPVQPAPRKGWMSPNFEADGLVVRNGTNTTVTHVSLRRKQISPTPGAWQYFDPTTGAWNPAPSTTDGYLIALPNPIPPGDLIYLSNIGNWGSISGETVWQWQMSPSSLLTSFDVVGTPVGVIEQYSPGQFTFEGITGVAFPKVNESRPLLRPVYTGARPLKKWKLMLVEDSIYNQAGFNPANPYFSNQAIWTMQDYYYGSPDSGIRPDVDLFPGRTYYLLSQVVDINNAGGIALFYVWQGGKWVVSPGDGQGWVQSGIFQTVFTSQGNPLVTVTPEPQNGRVRIDASVSTNLLGNATANFTQGLANWQADENAVLFHNTDPNYTIDNMGGSMKVTINAAGNVVGVGEIGPLTTGKDVMMYTQEDLASNDMEVSAVVVGRTTLANQQGGVMARVSTTALTWYVFETYGDAANVRLRKVVAGVSTTILNAAVTGGLAVPFRKKLTLQIIGSAIKGFVDDVQVLSLTDTSITTGTRAGLYMKANGNRDNIHLDDFYAKNFVSTNGPVDEFPLMVTQEFNSGTGGGGVFRVVGKDVIDPNDRKFIPVGMNVTAQPSVFPDAWWQYNTYYANGHGTEAAAWGVNIVRVFVPYDPDGGPTMDHAIAGTTSLINEYTALGIVCEIIVGPPQSNNGYNPTLATLPAYIREVQDRIVAAHKGNPYVWLNTMGEAWQWIGGADGGANWPRWSEVNGHLYQRARDQGWTGIQVFTLGGYGQGIQGAAEGNYYDTWKQGKTNVVFDFHNYGVDGNKDEITPWVDAFLARGNALIIGEFGEHWNRAGGGTSALPSDPVGVQWVNDLAWSKGVGGIAWNGAMNHFNVYSMRNNPNKHADTSTEAVVVALADYGRAFWHTDQPRSYVGNIIFNRGQLGAAVNGGGLYTGTGGGTNAASVGFTDWNPGAGTAGTFLFQTTFGADGGAAQNGMVDTPPLGLHGFNVPLRVSGGVARPDPVGVGAGYGDCIAYPASWSGQADQYAKARIRIGSQGVGSGGTGAYTGVQVRSGPVGGSNNAANTYSWYKFETCGDGNQVRYVRVLNGAISGVIEAEQYFNYSIQPGQTYEFYLEIKGTTLIGKINGQTIFTKTVSAIATGRPAITMYNQTTDQTVIEDFEAGDFVSSGGTAKPVTPMYVTGGFARATALNTDMLAYNTTDMTQANHWAEAVVRTGGVATNQQSGVSVRMSTTTGTETRYTLELFDNASQVRLVRVLAGVATVIGTGNVPGGILPNTSYTLRLEAYDSQLVGKVNGSTLISVTDTGITTGNRVGLKIRSAVDTASGMVDSFRAGKINRTTIPNPGGGGGTTPVSITQNFATGATAADANFTIKRGNVNITGGEMRLSALSTETDIYHNTDMATADHWAEVDLVFVGAVSNIYMGPCVRMSTGVDISWFGAEIDYDLGTVHLYKFVGGVQTALGTPYTTGWVTGSTHKIRLQAQGTTIKVYTDGVERISVTDSSLSTNTRVGLHGWSGTSLTTVRFDNFAAQALGAGGGGTTPPPGTITGKFHTEGNKIIDVNGEQMVPWGANVLSMPFPDPVEDSWWYSTCKTAHLHSTEAVNDWHFNMMRLMAMYDSSHPTITQQRVIDGVIRVMEEYIAKGVVCTWWAPNEPAANLNVAAQTGTFALNLFDQIVDHFKTHPLRTYVWLNPLNEPFNYGQEALWATVGTWYYNRARTAGWDGMFIWDCVGWGRNISSLTIASAGANFLSGKTDVVFSWHNYGTAAVADATAAVAAAQAAGFPIMIGEYGQHWNWPNQSSTDVNEGRGVLHAIDSGITQKVGGLVWTGGFSPSSTYTLRGQTGPYAFWQNDIPLNNMGNMIWNASQARKAEFKGGLPNAQSPAATTLVPVVTAAATVETPNGSTIVLTEDFNVGVSATDWGFTYVSGTTDGGLAGNTEANAATAQARWSSSNATNNRTPVTATLAHQAQVSVFCTQPETMYLKILWYKADGTPSATPFTAGAAVDCQTGGWSVLTVPSSVAPADATSAELEVVCTTATTASDVYMDAAVLTRSTGAVTSTDVGFVIERSLDGGFTWKHIWNNSLDKPFPADPAQVYSGTYYDRGVPIGGTANIIYRVYAVNNRSTAPVISQPIEAEIGPLTWSAWWLRSQHFPDMDMIILASAFQYSDDLQTQVIGPAGAAAPVVVGTGVPKQRTFNCTVWLTDSYARLRFQALVESGDNLYIQRNIGDGFFFRVTGSVNYGQRASAGQGTVRDVHQVTFTGVETEEA